MTKDEVANWLASVTMDAKAPHHEWPVYDQMLREAHRLLTSTAVEPTRERPACPEEAMEEASLSDWRKVHQWWGQDTEWKWHQSCRCSRCIDEYVRGVATQQQTMGDGWTDEQREELRRALNRSGDA